MELRKTIFLLLALLPLAASSQTPEVQEDNPGVYTVVPGDTLWDISGRFLKQPWPLHYAA